MHAFPLQLLRRIRQEVFNKGRVLTAVYRDELQVRIQTRTTVVPNRILAILTLVRRIIRIDDPIHPIPRSGGAG